MFLRSGISWFDRILRALFALAGSTPRGMLAPKDIPLGHCVLIPNLAFPNDVPRLYGIVLSFKSYFFYIFIHFLQTSRCFSVKTTNSQPLLSAHFRAAFHLL